MLLCENISGKDKLKPILIGNSENPRAFKSISKTILPVYYRYNQKT